MRIIIILLIGIFLIAIIFSGSRKSFGGFVLFILMWLFMCYRKELIKRPYYSIAFTIIFVLLYFVTTYMLENTYMGGRFDDNFGKHGKQNERVILYKEGVEMMKMSPLYGLGLGSYQNYSSMRTQAHSDYLEVVVGTGIIGFLLYFSMYAILWCRLSKIRKQTNDPSILYNTGLIKAIIITILFIAIGRPNINSPVTWVVLSSAIGYTWSLERKLILLRDGHNE